MGMGAVETGVRETDGIEGVGGQGDINGKINEENKVTKK